MAPDRDAFRSRLAEKLAESLARPLPERTPRHVHGTVAFPGKATAVIGMRRARARRRSCTNCAGNGWRAVCRRSGFPT